MFAASRRSFCRTVALTGVCTLALVGCSTRGSDAKRSDPASTNSAVKQGTRSSAAEMPAERVVPTSPEGWEAVPADGMRKAAYRVQQEGRQVEITLIDLDASANALLPNVNRWRQQIQLPEITQEELAGMTQTMEIGDVSGQYLELFSPEADQPRQAILGAIVVHGSRAWFAKLWGDADLAVQERERFQEFVRSLRFVPVDAHSEQGGLPAAGGSWAPAPAVQAVDSASEETIRYTVPDGWTPIEGSGLRRISFTVQEGEATAEVVAMGMEGTATRLLPNVNLWRRQVGLPDTTQEEVDVALQPIELDGRRGHYIRLEGPSEAERPLGMLVVLAGDQDRTWFFKMLGDQDLVLRQEERFEAFVRSVTFVAAGGEKND